MNIRKLFFSHQTVETTEPEFEFVREDFTLYNVDSMTIAALLQALCDQTYEFALSNRMTHATTEFTYIDDLPLTVELIDNVDYVYTVNAFKTRSIKDAIAVIQDAVQF